ncbi:MAG: lipid-A-disaccharide synthase [Bacteroidales bacterium]|nr:lipid-A-disaccharide synthase [Bacteroidales bacterium]
MKYYLIAGEASGDLHGSKLMQAIKMNDPDAEFRFWGGDKMQAQGGTLAKHYRDLAFMGYTEVILNLRTILRNISFCKKELVEYHPDVVILIDYPGFNLRMAKFASQQGLKVAYYISPTVWAWKQGRVKTIKKYVDRMMVILPFEKEFYSRFDYKADYVGHPLLDELDDEKMISRENFIKENKLDKRPVIALLPGSRVQEISRMLEPMLELVPEFADYQFVIAGVNSVPKDIYYVTENVKIVFNQTHTLLRISEAALVTSGTATLETALLNVPQVVAYKANAISFNIVKALVHLKYISLVNLIMDKEVVRELIQNDCTAQSLREELKKILPGSDERNRMLSDYQKLVEKLGTNGASEKAALVVKELAGQ